MGNECNYGYNLENTNSLLKKVSDSCTTCKNKLEKKQFINKICKLLEQSIKDKNIYMLIQVTNLRSKVRKQWLKPNFSFELNVKNPLAQLILQLIHGDKNYILYKLYKYLNNFCIEQFKAITVDQFLSLQQILFCTFRQILSSIYMPFIKLFIQGNQDKAKLFLAWITQFYFHSDIKPIIHITKLKTQQFIQNPQLFYFRKVHQVNFILLKHKLALHLIQDGLNMCKPHIKKEQTEFPSQLKPKCGLKQYNKSIFLISQISQTNFQTQKIDITYRLLNFLIQIYSRQFKKQRSTLLRNQNPQLLQTIQKQYQTKVSVFKANQNKVEILAYVLRQWILQNQNGNEIIKKSITIPILILTHYSQFINQDLPEWVYALCIAAYKVSQINQTDFFKRNF